MAEEKLPQESEAKELHWGREWVERKLLEALADPGLAFSEYAGDDVPYSLGWTDDVAEAYEGVNAALEGLQDIIDRCAGEDDRKRAKKMFMAIDSGAVFMRAAMSNEVFNVVVRFFLRPWTAGLKGGAR
jgi:hypothetical protein